MNKQIALLGGVNFGYYATTAILLPLLPIYFAMKGYSSQDIGLFMMIGPFIAVFAQPMWGYISDRFQKLKIIIVFLWSLTVISSVALFAVSGFAPTFLFVLLLYFFMLPAVPLLDSITMKSLEGTKFTYGGVRLWGSLGFCAVAVLSGFALDAFGGIMNIKYMYWASWTLPLALLLFLKDDKTGGGPGLTLQSLKAVFSNKPFMWFLLMIFILSVPHRMNDALFGLYLQDLKAHHWMISFAWALAAGSEIPTFALLTRYIQRYHELALLGIVSFLYTIRWLIYAFVQDPWVLPFFQMTHAVTFAAFWVIAVQYTVRLVPEQLRSTGLSLLSAVFLGLAGIVGGFVGGRIADIWNYSAMYGFGMVVCAVATVLFLGTHAVYRRKEIA